jgi:hypothetical protein
VPTEAGQHITISRLQQNRYHYQIKLAYIVDEMIDCDMIFLRVEGIANMEIVKFGTGKLEVGRLLWPMVILMIISGRVVLERIFTHVLLT